MATFEVTGVDEAIEEFENLKVDIDCPACNKPFEIAVNDLGDFITCPHCKAKIKVEQ